MFYEEIRFNKKHRFFLPLAIFIALIGFIPMAVFTIILTGETFWRHKLSIWGYIPLQGLILLACIVMGFFMRTISYRVKKIFRGEPVIILDDEGINNISTKYAFGFIAWDEIKGIESFRGGQQGNMGFIGIELDDLEGFIASKPLITRLALRSQALHYGNVLVINTTLLEGHFKPVVRKVKEAWEQHRK